MGKIVEVLNPEKAFRYEYLEADEPYLQMLEDRNRTSHIYDRERARKIFARIKNRHVQNIGKIVERLI